MARCTPVKHNQSPFQENFIIKQYNQQYILIYIWSKCSSHLQRYLAVLHNNDIGDTWRQNNTQTLLSDAELAAYVHHGHRLYRYGQPHMHLDWRLPKCEI